MTPKPIKPIRSDSDYDAALEEIERLFAAEPGSEDADRMEVLVVLAQYYQHTHHPVGPPDMQSAIEFEMDRRGLTRQTADTHPDVAGSGVESTGSARSEWVPNPVRASRTEQPA